MESDIAALEYRNQLLGVRVAELETALRILCDCAELYAAKSFWQPLPGARTVTPPALRDAGQRARDTLEDPRVKGILDNQTRD